MITTTPEGWTHEGTDTVPVPVSLTYETVQRSAADVDEDEWDAFRKRGQ